MARTARPAVTAWALAIGFVLGACGDGGGASGRGDGAGEGTASGQESSLPCGEIADALDALGRSREVLTLLRFDVTYDDIRSGATVFDPDELAAAVASLRVLEPIDIASA